MGPSIKLFVSVDDRWLVTDPCTFRLNGAEAEGDDGSYFSLSVTPPPT